VADDVQVGVALFELGTLARADDVFERERMNRKQLAELLNERISCRPVTSIQVTVGRSL